MLKFIYNIILYITIFCKEQSYDKELKLNIFSKFIVYNDRITHLPNEDVFEMLIYLQSNSPIDTSVKYKRLDSNEDNYVTNDDIPQIKQKIYSKTSKIAFR